MCTILFRSMYHCFKHCIFVFSIATMLVRTCLVTQLRTYLISIYPAIISPRIHLGQPWQKVQRKVKMEKRRATSRNIRHPRGKPTSSQRRNVEIVYDYLQKQYQYHYIITSKSWRNLLQIAGVNVVKNMPSNKNRIELVIFWRWENYGKKEIYCML